MKNNILNSNEYYKCLPVNTYTKNILKYNTLVLFKITHFQYNGKTNQMSNKETEGKYETVTSKMA